MTLAAPIPGPGAPSPKVPRPSRAGVHLAVLALVFPAACASDPTQGYALRQVHSESIRTISVPIFENTTFATGLEAELTEAVVKEIQRTTRWSVVRSAGSDATLTGAVISSDIRRLSGDPVTGLDQEMGVDIRVDFDLKDNRSGRVLVGRRGFAVTETFVATRRVGELPQIGRTGAVQALARDIVAELRDTW